MMRGLQITAIAFAVIFFFLSAYYVSAVSTARFMSYYDSYSSYGSYSYSSYNSSYDLTFTAGIYSLLFCLFFAAIHILSLLKIKTKTMKVMSIIGISLTGIGVLLAFLAIGSGGGASYDEIGPVFTLYSLAAVAFHIVGTIHAFKQNA